VQAPKRRPLRGKGTGAPVGGGGGGAIGAGGTPTHNSVAPISMPVAGGLRVCSTAAIAGSGRDEADWRRGMVSSTIQPGSPVAAARTTAAAHREGSRGLRATGAAGRGVAGSGSLPTGIDAARRPQGGSSPTTRAPPPRASLPNGHEAPQCIRIPRPAARLRIT
jgi:hypothetical protein